MPLPKMPDVPKRSGEPNFDLTSSFDDVVPTSPKPEMSPVDEDDDDLGMDLSDFSEDATPSSSSSGSGVSDLDDDMFADEDDDDVVDTPIRKRSAPSPAPSPSPFGDVFSSDITSTASRSDLAKQTLSKALDDPNVTEISINGPHEMFVRVKGGNVFVPEFDLGDDIEEYHSVLNSVLISGRTKLGSTRAIAKDFLVEAQIILHYPDGDSVARCHILTPPISPAAIVTIAKRPAHPITLADMVAGGTMTAEMSQFAVDLVRAHKNVVISGGTGAGKTTLLSALGSEGFRDDEKLVVIEDLPELDFGKHFSNYLTTTPEKPGVDPNRVTMDYLVRQTKRMRVARVVIGEVRGPEIRSFLDVAKSGVSGSMNTLHAESPDECLKMIQDLAMSGENTSGAAIGAIKESIVAAIDFVIQAKREEGKEHNRHLVTSISEVGKSLNGGNFGLTEIFSYDPHTDNFIYNNPPSDSTRKALWDQNLPSAQFFGRMSS